ncbi:hypothetical protein [Clostridium perfringens]|uniref:hypothetical protein n=1 Tax=Clostridium perfringens TaxID=1502 RepID=UPI00016BD479|nr:hypothetical protein [Clostridium perfringens]
MNLSSKENDVKRLVEKMVDIKEEQSKSDLVINVRMKVDEESFENFKRKIIEIKEELNNEYTYEVLTKDEYIKRALIGLSFTKEELNEHWNKISNGFNFIIKCGKNEYCSVGRFNKMLEV